MNELEKVVSPHLSAMMRGVVVRLPPEIKRIISAWAAKAAMMLMYFLTPPEPPHADYLEALHDEKVLAPPKLGVWLASYSGESPGQFTIREAAGGWSAAIHTAHCVSLSLGACVIQVWLWDDPRQPPRVPPFEDMYPDHVVPIWPGWPHVQEWPPATPFSDIPLWRYFGRNEREIRRTIALLTRG